MDKICLLKYNTHFLNVFTLFIVSSIIFQYPLSVNVFSSLFNLVVLIIFIYVFYIAIKYISKNEIYIMKSRELKFFIFSWGDTI